MTDSRYWDDRFWDDLVLDEPINPPSYRFLVAYLGVDRASAAEQRAAVDTWLRQNTPSNALRADLAARGFAAA